MNHNKKHIFLNHIFPKDKLLKGIYIKKLSENLESINFESSGCGYFFWNKTEIINSYENNKNLFDKYHFSDGIPNYTSLRLCLNFNDKVDDLTEFEYDIIHDMNDIYSMILDKDKKALNDPYNENYRVNIHFFDQRINGLNVLVFSGLGSGIKFHV